MKAFIRKILTKYYKNEEGFVFEKSPLLQYLDSKMGAVEGSSKTRRSLANIYAIYYILHFYIEDFYNKKNKYQQFEGFEYTQLFNFYRQLYGGKKLQNHALNNRINGEFENKFHELQGKPLIIVNNDKYLLHIDILISYLLKTGIFQNVLSIPLHNI